MHALKSQHVCSATASLGVPRSFSRPLMGAGRLRRSTASTAAAARPCCSVSKAVPRLSALPSSSQYSRRRHTIVARDSPYREYSSSSTPDDSNSRQQDADPDGLHDLPAAESLDSTPNTSAGGKTATVDNIEAMLPPGAATAQGGSPQDAAAAQTQHGHKSPKHAAAPAGQKLQTQLQDMASKYQALDQRLDHMESTLISLLRSVKETASRPAAVAAVGPGGEAAAADGGVVAVAAAGQAELPEGEFDALFSGDEHGSMFDIKRLQSSLAENINRGYLESVKHMREMLMAYEWHLHGKELAERKGVALFERHCAENDLGVPFDTLTALYQDPNDFSVLGEDKLKLLARSIIQGAVDERYCSIYFECTTTAKELAHTGLKDVIPDSAGKVGGVIKDILPLPRFLKK